MINKLINYNVIKIISYYTILMSDSEQEDIIQVPGEGESTELATSTEGEDIDTTSILSDLEDAEEGSVAASDLSRPSTPDSDIDEDEDTDEDEDDYGEGEEGEEEEEEDEEDEEEDDEDDEGEVEKDVTAAVEKVESKPSAMDAINSLESDKDDTDTESEVEDEELFQKLAADIESTVLLDKHPGITQNSYDQILTLSKVVRNDKGEIVDDLHRTYPFITKYEKAKIVGVRTKQLNNGADPFIEVNPNIINGYNIALQEFEQKKLPFIIARPLPNGAREYWRLSDLEMIHY